MKVASIALLALSTVKSEHVPKSVTSYNLCVHDYECAVEGDKCCQAVMSGGDGVMLLRCGPWLDYSGYTGAVNGYMYKCEDEGARHLFASAAALALAAATMF